jgi:hypothetical protein
MKITINKTTTETKTVIVRREKQYHAMKQVGQDLEQVQIKYLRSFISSKVRIDEEITTEFQ